MNKNGIIMNRLCRWFEAGEDQLVRAELLRMNDDYGNALRILDELGGETARHWKFRIYQETGRVEEALALVHAVDIQDDASRRDYQQLSGSALALRGERHGAVRHFLETALEDEDALARIVEPEPVGSCCTAIAWGGAMMLDPKKRKQQLNGPMVHRNIRTETTYTPTETVDRTHTDALEHGDHTPDHAQPTQDIRSQVHHWNDSQGQAEQNAAVTQEETSVFKEPFSIRRVRKSKGNKLTAMLQVRNERGRYLEEVLHDLSEFVDEIVIVDDASTDGTPDLCKAYPKVVRLEVLEKPLFAEEWRLRNTLWQAAAGTRPDWLLSVDADEPVQHRGQESHTYSD